MFQFIFGENDENKNNQNKKNQKNQNMENQEYLPKKDVYTYFKEPTPLQKRGMKSSEAYRHHRFTNSAPTPTLHQGQEFKKLQKKIKKEVKKKQRFITEGFGDMNTNSNMNANANTNENELLVNQYNNLLVEYQNVKRETNSRAQKVVQQMNPSNPYLKQNILFSTGQIAYVTEKGVVKLYPDKNTFDNLAGKNNCPSSEPVNVNIPWDPSYTFPGTTIPTSPPLMSGTPMQKGQMCGNEDSNILVNQVASDASSDYLGCYQDDVRTPLMKAVNSGAQIYNNSTCLQSAIDASYNYYSLQNLDSSTGLAQCFLTNDLNQAETYGKATQVCTQQKDGYIYGGPLNTAVYKTQDSTYLGSYRDSYNRTMKAINNRSRTYDYNSCSQEALKSGNQYFGLQYFNDETQKSQCFVSNDVNKSTSLGNSNTSTLGNDGKMYGRDWENAIYENNSDSPYLGCYNNTSKMTVVNNGSATYNMASCQQYAQENGFSFFGLQNVQMETDPLSGNPQAKCLVSNSIDQISNSGMAEPCIKGKDGFNYGNIGVNALYQVTQGGSLSDIGKMGYVNPNGVLSDYPNSTSQLSTTYSTLTNYDNMGNDIPNSSYGNASDQMCQKTCNNIEDCYGYVFDISTSTCYPKNSGIYPNSEKQPNPNRSLNLRNKKLTPGTAATNRKVVNVDSNTWSHYVNSGKTVPNTRLNTDYPYGFNSFIENFTSSSSSSSDADANANTSSDPVQENVLSQLEDRLKLLSQQINTNTSLYNTNTQNVNRESVDIDTNIKKYISEYDEIKEKLKEYSKTTNKNVSNILKDSDLVVKSQNYTYLLYAILLLGVAMVALKVMNSK